MKKGRRRSARPHDEEVVLLRDLVPRAEVKGGAGKILFGERVDDGGAAVNGHIRERSSDDRPKRKA